MFIILAIINCGIEYKNVLLQMYKTLVRQYLDNLLLFITSHYRINEEVLERIQKTFSGILPELETLTIRGG